MDEAWRPVEVDRQTAHEDGLARVSDAVYTLDTDLRYTYVNERARALFGRSDRDGRDVDDKSSPATPRSLFGDAHERALEDQRPITIEERDETAERWLEARCYPDETGVTVIVRDVTDRAERERELERQRERLAALDHVNGVVREINDAVVNGSTRTRLERIACESLADSPSYEFAFVADVDSTANDISPRAEAGVDDYVETTPLSTAPDDPIGRGPAGKAIRSGEVQVSNDVLADPDFEPWRDDAREHGYRSAAAIPISHDGVLYGILGVTSARRNAFADEERDVVGQLGDILGHAIAALERRRVLLGDDLIELEFVIDDAVALFDGPEQDEWTVQFDRVVRIDDGRYLEYGTTAAETFPTLEALVECVPHWDEVSVLDRSAGDVTFELSITDPPMFGVIDAYGGYVEEAVITNGDYTTTVHFPRETDLRAVMDDISDVYPGARTVARRQVSPSSESLERLRNRLANALTDRQRTALETAYYGGYFEWPRNSSGEDIAEAMDVTPATFHEHLRTAQRKVVGAVVDEPRPTRGKSTG